MLRTADLLDRLKAAYQLPSDYALAKKLGVTRAAVSRYRNNVGSFDDKLAFEVAYLLELNPSIVVASMHMERAKRQNDKSLIDFWSQYAH